MGGSNEGAGFGGDSARVFPMKKLVTIVGGEKPQVCKTLIHLVMADSAYVENTEQGIRQSTTSVVILTAPPSLQKWKILTYGWKRWRKIARLGRQWL